MSNTPSKLCPIKITLLFSFSVSLCGSLLLYQFFASEYLLLTCSVFVGINAWICPISTRSLTFAGFYLHPHFLLLLLITHKHTCYLHLLVHLHTNKLIPTCLTSSKKCLHCSWAHFLFMFSTLPLCTKSWQWSCNAESALLLLFMIYPSHVGRTIQHLEGWQEQHFHDSKLLF